ncbi:MAG: dipeptide epimerase [Pseudomonadales bacterium]
MKINLSAKKVCWPLKTAFITSQDNLLNIEVIHVEIDVDGVTGRGEALGVDYHGETVESILADIESVRSVFEEVVDFVSLRTQLLQTLPAGGARNALDCAVWDLEAKSTGQRVWALLKMPAKPVDTMITLSLDTPAAMAEQAHAETQFSVLKLKVDAGDPITCIESVRIARPDCKLVVDANSDWNIEQLQAWAPECKRLDVSMIEQPLPADADEVLADMQFDVPLCADESLQDSAQFDYVAARYQVVNIKLDKTGGLTEAVRLLKIARLAGKDVFVGNMLGSSLAMAPAFVIAQYSQWVDLDGPLLQAEDVQPAIQYQGSSMSVPDRQLWG